MALSKQQQKELAIAEQIVQKFNKKFPVDSTVMHRKIANKAYPYEPRTVRATAFVSGSNDPVVFFKELSGYYIITPDFVDYDS